MERVAEVQCNKSSAQAFGGSRQIQMQQKTESQGGGGQEGRLKLQSENVCSEATRGNPRSS